jgi:hypothetical protein
MSIGYIGVMDANTHTLDADRANLLAAEALTRETRDRMTRASEAPWSVPAGFSYARACYEYDLAREYERACRARVIRANIGNSPNP